MNEIKIIDSKKLKNKKIIIALNTSNVEYICNGEYFEASDIDSSSKK